MVGSGDSVIVPNTTSLLGFGWPIIVVFTLCHVQTTIFQSQPFEAVVLYWQVINIKFDYFTAILSLFLIA